MILGTAEECARLLERRRREVAAGETRRGGGAARREIRAAGGRLPGFGHPVHKPLDPRAERILELADARGVTGAARRARARVPRRGRRGLGQAADDERLDADRRGDARPRLPGLDASRRSRSSRARPACSPTSPRSSEQPIGFLMAASAEEAVAYEPRRRRA